MSVGWVEGPLSWFPFRTIRIVARVEVCGWPWVRSSVAMWGELSGDMIWMLADDGWWWWWIMDKDVIKSWPSGNYVDQTAKTHRRSWSSRRAPPRFQNDELLRICGKLMDFKARNEPPASWDELTISSLRHWVIWTQPWGTWTWCLRLSMLLLLFFSRACRAGLVD